MFKVIYSVVGCLKSFVIFYRGVCNAGFRNEFCGRVGGK